MEKAKRVGHRFFDAPYGSTICNCGKKVVHQGHCQSCWNKFQKGLKKELNDIILEKVKYETKTVGKIIG